MPTALLLARLQSNMLNNAQWRLRRGLRQLGPGMITGAAEDDPSGIATCSQAGSQFGHSMLWTAVLTLPLMAAIQMVNSRIGYVMRHGLALIIKRHFPKSILNAVMGMLRVATQSISRWPRYWRFLQAGRR